MSLPAQFDGLEKAVLPPRPLHLAIGIFDGVHLGHRAVIESAVQSARRSGGVSAVLTFDPHPSAVLRPAQATKLLMSRAAKARVLGELGVEIVITQPFDETFAALAAEDFLIWLRRYAPRLAGIYVGENWRFGRGRAGDVAMLVAEGRRHGVHVFSAPRVNLDGEAISSSRIRTLLEAGQVSAANSLLGYAYVSEGRVAPGKKLGRTISFPTLNLDWTLAFRPRLGVYVVRIGGGKTPTALRGVANFGLRPTVEKTTEPRLEVHALDECPYDAGDEIVVEWLEFLRPEMKFGGLGTLRAQIAADREAAIAYFRSS